eukprot:GFYU01004463.1.p1 GENE.GFYU01004463.1~~GFYU01004463.1.p1  ORF type:complete len:395 (-),score=97.72 GFYU01004463.1:253-1437(-)
MTRLGDNQPATQGTPIVNAWTEWDPLEEIFVGIADGNTVPPMEPAHKAKVWDKPLIWSSNGPRGEDKTKLANQELDGLVAMLESLGVTCQRPEVLPNKPVAAQHYTCEFMNGWTCPRDTLLTIGPEIIESPMSWRSRALESIAYRKTLMQFFEADENFRWTSPPHPGLPDELYRWDYPTEQTKLAAQVEAANFVTVPGVEPVFDAADVLRLGKDVLVLHGNTCNLAGYKWLERHLRVSYGIRAHKMHFPTVMNASHIDAAMMPLRPPTEDKPGFLIAHPDLVPYLWMFNQDSAWEVIPGAPPAARPEDMSPLAKSSPWISLNMLPIDPQRVIVEETETPLIQQLEHHGFEVLTLPFRNVIEFGGGLHCCTNDIRRRGTLKSYFPTLDAADAATH